MTGDLKTGCLLDFVEAETKKFFETIELTSVLYWLEELKEDLMQSITDTDFPVLEVNSVYDLDDMYSDRNIDRKVHQIYAINYALRLCKKEKPE